MPPFPDKPSIAILGSGAVGGYYGARLAQAGLPVHFLFRSEYDHVKHHGLTIRSIDGDFSIPAARLNVYRSTTDMPKVDLVIVTLKSTDNPALAHLIPPLLHDHTAILTLQNGLGNEDHLAQLFGQERVLGGIAFTCINRVSPGHIHHQDHGHIKLGDFSPTPLSRDRRERYRAASPRATQIATLFTQSKIRTTPIPNLLEARWSKLTWNIPFNGLTTLLDVPTDALLTTPDSVRLIETIIEEVRATAATTGIHLPSNIAAQQIELTRSMGPYLTSTQLDRRNRRPLELDSIFTRPLTIAQAAHLPTPCLEFLNVSLHLLNTTSTTRTP
jgi:2-dehydropantoate 2-reductase